MKSTTTILVLSLAIAGVASPLAHADGEGCTASQTRQSAIALRQAEDAEKSGRVKDAYTAATRSIPAIDCAVNGNTRRIGLIERTSKRLGDEAEKAGRYGEAFDYYSAPQRHGQANHNLADADRALLKQVEAKPGDYKLIFFAAGYFEHRGIRTSVDQTRVIAKASGENALSVEAKAFAGSRQSLNELQKAREWFEIAGDTGPVKVRAVQRGDALLAHGAFSSVERAFQYYDFAGDQKKRKSAQARARRLGDEHAKTGQTRVAAQFYILAGDNAKAAALEKKMDARDDKGEAKRREQFKKDQKSLEKELGL
jgi:hypothetical protein